MGYAVAVGLPSPTPAVLSSLMVEWWIGNVGTATGTNNTWTGIKNGNVLTAAGTARPALTTGPQGFWTFDGVNTGFLCSGFPSMAQPFEYFVGLMVTTAGGANQGYVIDFGASDACQIFQAVSSGKLQSTSDVTGVTPTINAYAFLENQYSGGNEILGMNGVQHGSVVAGGAGTGGMSIGRAFSVGTAHNFAGNVYEIIVFNKILEAQQRAIVNAYMASPH